MLKQPSLKFHSSPVSSIISGFINVFLKFFNAFASDADKDSSSEKGAVSTKKRRMDNPICGAANPTP